MTSYVNCSVSDPFHRPCKPYPPSIYLQCTMYMYNTHPNMQTNMMYGTLRLQLFAGYIFLRFCAVLRFAGIKLCYFQKCKYNIILM